jgi:malonyl CoA-acyl carrier protein transacylase
MPLAEAQAAARQQMEAMMAAQAAAQGLSVGELREQAVARTTGLTNWRLG